MQGLNARKLAIALVLGWLALAAAACEDEDEPESAAPLTTTVVAPTTAATTTTEPGARGDTASPEAADKPHGPAESAEDDPRMTAPEHAAAGAVRDYVAALDAGDGERVCALLAPGAIDEVELPRDAGDCAASVTASIGYRDPRGLPVWEGAELSGIRSIEVDGQSAKVVATVVTRFADRDEVSIEDDVVYLGEVAGRWLVAKPSSTLYRAVGIADVPPSVFSPPN